MSSTSNKEITVIHENKNFIIINKPAGVITHPDGKVHVGAAPSVAEQILKLYPEIENIGEPLGPVLRPGIVHRLDTETSGVMIIARTQKFFEYIKAQFQEHTVHKEYRAFVWGWFKDEIKKGVIDWPVGRRGSDFRKYVTGRFARGDMREAVTYYEILNKFEIDEKETAPHAPRFSYMSLMPKTGRTHQIRVHMKHIHHGIVADPLYMENHPKILGFERQALHALMIHFNDMDGKPLTFEAPLPQDFNDAIEKYLIPNSKYVKN